MNMTTIEHRGAIIQLPASVVVDNWLESIKPKTAGTTASTIPQLGEYWHGQGGIYAARMRGNAGQPDRHLIVPITSDALNFKSEWGCNGKEITGADNNLYGMPNTVAMAGAGSELAKKILGLEVEGHNDFYLGARHEYRACYLNVPELFNKEWYWTSTQHDAYCAFMQHFDDGGQHCYDKLNSSSARPVRSFVI